MVNDYIIHRVRAGESLQDVCFFYNADPIKVRCLNNVDEWWVGKILIIPRTNCYIVMPEDTIESIAKQCNVSPEHIKEKNKIQQIFLGQKILI